MRLSQKKRDALYAAIHEENTKVRIELQKMLVDNGVDSAVGQLVTPTFNAVLEILNSKP